MKLSNASTRLLFERGPHRPHAWPLLVLGLIAIAAPAHGQVLTEVEGAARVCTRAPAADIASAQRLAGAARKTAAAALPNPSVVLEHQREVEGPTDRET